MRFVDTNVAVYAVGTLAEDDRKQAISEELLAREADSLAVSVQVLGDKPTRAWERYNRGRSAKLKVSASRLP